MTFSSQDAASAIRGVSMCVIDKRQAVAVAMREAFGCAASLADAWTSPRAIRARHRQQNSKKIADALDADGKALGGKG